LTNGATPLIIASYLGQAACVSLLLKDSTINPALPFQERTALQLAQPSVRVVDWKFLDDQIKIEGRQNVVQLLVDAGACNSSNVVAEGETKESKESKESKKLPAKMEKNQGKAAVRRSQRKYTKALCKAVREENLTMIQLLLAKDETNVNEVGTEGVSPLYSACAFGFTSVVELLLASSGIAINQAQTTYGDTPLSMACHQGHVPVVKLLLAASDINVNQARTDNGCTPLFRACENGHTPVVKLLLASSGIAINQARTTYGDTPLFIACINGHAPVVKLLLASSGIAVNQATKDNGCTPFFIACEKGHASVVELFLASSDTDVNQPHQEGATPLYVACQNGHSEIVQQLLVLITSHSININQPVISGEEKDCTPLIVASYAGSALCVEQLLLFDTIDCASLYEGNNALAWARPSARSVGLSFLDERINVEGRANVVQLLVDAGAQ